MIGPRPPVSRRIGDTQLVQRRREATSTTTPGMRTATGGLLGARGGGGLVQDQGEGMVSAGGIDPGGEWTWESVGRPDMAALAGKTVMTMNGPYVVPLVPPRPGLRTTTGGL